MNIGILLDGDPRDIQPIEAALFFAGIGLMVDSGVRAYHLIERN